MRFVNKETGSGTGISRAAVLAFAREDATVVVNSQSEGSSVETLERFRALGRERQFAQGDIPRAEGAQRILDESLSAFGRLDILVKKPGKVFPVEIMSPPPPNVVEADFRSRVTDVHVLELCSPPVHCPSATMRAKICLIAPFASLAETALSIRNDLNIDMDVLSANLEDALTHIPRLEAEGASVLISRGRTAELLRRHTAIPVISIKVSGLDILQTIADLAGKSVRICFVGHADVLRDCQTVADALGIPAYCIPFPPDGQEDYNIMRLRVRDRLNRDPVDFMIGDTIPLSHFSDLCPQIRAISSGPETVREAIERAQLFLEMLEQSRINSEHLRAVLDMIEKAVFSLDGNGRISDVNSAATAIFGMSRTEMLGLSIAEIDPALDVADELLASDNREICQVIETAHGRMVSYIYPIVQEGVCRSMVLTLERVERIRSIEQKVRHQERQKGQFVARHHLEDYVTQDPALKNRLNQMRSYARTDGTVLITGESGTGKEILAQGIHNASRRADGPFVAVNCGALPPTLLESELFGYVDGAFTGTVRKGKRGLFELADKGTLFLDEIGELDKALQARLLRVIQERQIMRLGSEHPVQLDIRIVAATNQNLASMVEEGTFREDLYYRLNVLRFETVPLRERLGDIVPSALALLRSNARLHGYCTVDLDADLRRWLTEHDWPGNNRQLGNIIERIAITSDEPVARLAVVKCFLDEHTRTGRPKETSCADCHLLNGDLESVRHNLAAAVMLKENNCKTQAAKRLGVDRGTLARWLTRQGPAGL